MMALEFLESEFELSRSVRETIQRIDEQMQEDFNCKNEYVIPKASSVYYNEICVQKDSR